MLETVIYSPILAWCESEMRYINHFPTRVLTFFNTRYRYLNQGSDRWLTIETTYRGQRIKSRYHARAKSGEQGFDLVRLSDAEQSE